MERIGIAASKMAQGNLFLYNMYVILISLLFSLFIFIVVGITVLLGFIIIAYVGDEIMDIQKDWSAVLPVCMASLTVIMFLFNLVAISRNLKFSKPKD